MTLNYSTNEHRRSVEVHLRLPGELEEKLEVYRKQKRHPSFSHTVKYFLKLGIKSTELLEELKDNPSKKENIMKEWEECLNHITLGDAVEEELERISDEDLETIVMLGYCEIYKRKRKMKTQEFQSQEHQIRTHVESYMTDGINELSEDEFTKDSVRV